MLHQLGNHTEFLSFPWGPSCPPYGNGQPCSIVRKSQISEGGSSNSLWISGSNHIGTHMDFPLHFCQNGKSVDQYAPADFIFSCPLTIDLDDFPEQTLIDPTHVEAFFSQEKVSKPNESVVDLILLKTNATRFRGQNQYWERGPGLGLGLAAYFRSHFPLLKAVGIDAISITSYAHRETGRAVHREFLCESHPLMLIEDMNLQPLNTLSLTSVIALPLRIEGGDGAPASIIAFGDKAKCVPPL